MMFVRIPTPAETRAQQFAQEVGCKIEECLRSLPPSERLVYVGALNGICNILTAEDVQARTELSVPDQRGDHWSDVFEQRERWQQVVWEEVANEKGYYHR